MADGDTDYLPDELRESSSPSDSDQAFQDDEADDKNWRWCLRRLHVFSARIERDADHLSKIVDRHYDRIWSTWQSLNYSQRHGKLMVAQWLMARLGDQVMLPKNRRPDITGITKANSRYTPPLTGLIWPYLSQEALSWGDAMLIYIYHRAKTNWVGYQKGDLQAARGAKEQLTGFTNVVYREDSEYFPQPEKAKRYIVKFKKLDSAIRDRNDGSPDDLGDSGGPGDRNVPTDPENPGLPGIIEEDNYVLVPKTTGGEPKGRDILDKFSVSDATIVVVIQEHIYRFLACVCIAILKPDKGPLYSRLFDKTIDLGKWLGNAFDELGDDTRHPITATVAPEDRPDRCFSGEGADSAPFMADLRIQAVYGPPSEIQWKSLLQLINGEVSDICNTLTQMRQNPDFFRRSIYRKRIERDQTGFATMEPSGLDFKGPKKREKWREAVKFCVGNTFKEFDRWHGLRDAFLNLRSVYVQHKERLANRDGSSEFWHAAQHFDVALYGFWNLARQYSELLIPELQDAVLRSPMLEDYIREAHMVGTMTRKKLVLTETFEKNHTEPSRKLVYKRLLRLLADPDDRLRFGLAALLDELERAIHGSSLQWHTPEDDDDHDHDHDRQEKRRERRERKKEKAEEKRLERVAYLPDHIHRMLSRLAVFAECLNQAERFQPFGTLLDAAYEIDSEAKKNIRDSCKKLEDTLGQLTSSDGVWDKLLKLALPDEERFAYPYEDELTEETIKKLEAAEKKLDRFWQAFERQFGPKKQQALSQMALEFLETILKRAFWRIPDPVPQVEGKGKEKEERPKWLDYGFVVSNDTLVPAADAVMTAAGSCSPKTPKTPESQKRRRNENEPGDEGSPPKIRRVDRTNQAVDPAVNRDDQQPEDQQPEDQQPEHQQPEHQQPEHQQPADYSSLHRKILVSAESMETLGFLFFVKGRRYGGKQLRYADLKKFLADVGFYLKRQNGNIRQFEPGPELATRLPPEQALDGDTLSATKKTSFFPANVQGMVDELAVFAECLNRCRGSPDMWPAGWIRLGRGIGQEDACHEWTSSGPRRQHALMERTLTRLTKGQRVMPNGPYSDEEAEHEEGQNDEQEGEQDDGPDDKEEEGQPWWMNIDDDYSSDAPSSSREEGDHPQTPDLQERGEGTRTNRPSPDHSQRQGKRTVAGDQQPTLHRSSILEGRQFDNPFGGVLEDDAHDIGFVWKTDKRGTTYP
ncbi:hypothetical protein GE09DRAFT_1195625 [Coniochaeta sp. 2T2.1]|nr:hypothetical protein GE09DRAFT_1195625 [Coniochaeta sp. 2T2.1]